MLQTVDLFSLDYFVKLLLSTCDSLQLPLHVAPLLNFVRGNTRVIRGKKSSYPWILPVARAELSSGVSWLSVYLMNSERHSASTSPSCQQWLSSHQSSCANQSKDSEASIFATHFYSGRDARQQHSAALFCCLVPCIIIPLVYTSSDCFPKADMGSQVTVQRRTLIIVN